MILIKDPFVGANDHYMEIVTSQDTVPEKGLGHPIPSPKDDQSLAVGDQRLEEF